MRTLFSQPLRDRKPYRLRARFRIEPFPSPDRLDREKVKVAETFVADMGKQGWDNAESFGFSLRGPFAMIVPTQIRVRRTPTAREMLPMVALGARFLEDTTSPVTLVPALAESEWWEYELAGVFVREQIMVERADAHEEELAV